MYGSGSFPFLIKVFSGLKYRLQNQVLAQNFSKKFNFKTENNVLASKLQEKNMEKNNLFCILKVTEEGSRIH